MIPEEVKVRLHRSAISPSKMRSSEKKQAPSSIEKDEQWGYTEEYSNTP
jgi:hypothetical protein